MTKRWIGLGFALLAPVLGGAHAGCSGNVPPGGSGGTGGTPDAGVPCASSASCPEGQHCTTEDGACNRPPGCGVNDGCPAVCYGVCASDALTNPCKGKSCGDQCDGLFGSALPTYCDAAGQCRPMASPPQCAADCSRQESELVAFLKSNKACTTSAECELRSVGCGVTDDGCTGTVYVNQSMDDAAFEKLASAFIKCKTGETSCIACERLSRPPACVNGLCQAAPF